MQSSITILGFLLLMDHVLSGLNEKRLLRDLFDTARPDAHNPMERPSEYESEALNVSAKFYLNQVMDVDEKNQVLTTIIWIDLTWNDYHFRWNPSEYGNVTAINLPYTAVWRPDILLYNCADEKFDPIYPTNTIMRYNGAVQWMPPGMFKSTCNIDISWFPFDEQFCILKFGTWTYYGDQINLQLQCINASDPECTQHGVADLSEYSQNGEFHLITATVKRSAQRYECCDYDFIDIKLTIQLQRRALYYVFNLIVPCVLISGMSLMVFMLPPDAGEKISLGVTILLSLTMFLQMVADKLPQTSEALPLMGIYFCCCMILCSLSIVFTVLVLNYHHRSADVGEVPNWIKVVVNLYLAKLMIMERPHRISRVVPEDVESVKSFGSLVKDENGSVEENEQPDHVIQRVKRNSYKDVHPNRGSGIPTAQTDQGRIKPNGLLPSPKSDMTSPEVYANKVGAIQERSSKSLLANVLNLEDDFRACAPISSTPVHHQTPVKPALFGTPRTRVYGTDVLSSSPPPYSTQYNEENYNPDFDTTPDALSPDNLSELSANVVSPHSSEASQKSSISPALLSSYRVDLENIATELRFITRKIRDDEQEGLVNLEWKFAARVIDRFCLVIFGTLNLVTTGIMLFSAPNLAVSFKP